MSQGFYIAFTRDFLKPDGGLIAPDIGLEAVAGVAGVQHSFLPEYHNPVRPEQIAEADGLVIIYPHITRETFARGAERLVVIARSGAGYERVDLAACTEHDVAVTNAPQAVAHATAAASLMFMLVLAKQLLRLDQLTRAGRWAERTGVAGIELRGRTLGIVGLGHAGRELARLAAPFAMRQLAYSPHADPAQAQALNVPLVDLDTLLREADFVCLHCRLTEATRGLIGPRELGLMKPSAYLVNMARGPVVDHAALLTALRERRIAGAGLDVFDQEPVPGDDPILQLDNVVVAPHWAAGTLDVFREAGLINLRGMLQAARGEVPDNLINPEVVQRPGWRRKMRRFGRGG